MTNKILTREYYVNMWATILDAYRWWGMDLTSLLSNIKKTNPIVADLFDKIYFKEGDIYVRRKYNRTTMFYQMLDSLIPDMEEVYTKIEVKSFNTINEDLEEKSLTCKLCRADFILPILCFTEEFATFSLKNEQVASKKNVLFAYSKNIVFLVEKQEEIGITKVQITIPCKLRIEYSASRNPIK